MGRTPIPIDLNIVKKRYCENFDAISDIATDMGVSADVIRTRLRQEGIHIRSTWETRRIQKEKTLAAMPKPLTAVEMKKMRTDAGHSRREWVQSLQLHDFYKTLNSAEAMVFRWEVEQSEPPPKVLERYLAYQNGTLAEVSSGNPETVTELCRSLPDTRRFPKVDVCPPFLPPVQFRPETQARFDLCTQMIRNNSTDAVIMEALNLSREFVKRQRKFLKTLKKEMPNAEHSH